MGPANGETGSGSGSVSNPSGPSQTPDNEPWQDDPLIGWPNAQQLAYEVKFTSIVADSISNFEQNLSVQPVPHVPAVAPVYNSLTGDVMRMVAVNGRLPILSGSALNQISSQIMHTEPVGGDGEFTMDETDLSFPGEGIPFVFARHYRSGAEFQTTIGFGWNHSFDQHLVLVDKSTVQDPNSHPDIIFIDDRLFESRFTFNGTDVNGNDIYSAVGPTPMRLSHRANSAAAIWTLNDGSDHLRVFDGAHGNLIRIQDYAGHALRITWDQHPNLSGLFWNASKPRVSSVVDTTGRTLYFNYRVVSLADAGLAALIGSRNKPSGLYWSGWGSNDTGAEYLKCISLTQDCAKPLVSFDVGFRLAYSPDQSNHESSLVPAGWFIEFDLRSVHDTKGNGPTYHYKRSIDNVTKSDLAYQKSFQDYWPSKYANEYYKYLLSNIHSFEDMCPSLVRVAIYDALALEKNCDLINCYYVAMSPTLNSQLSDRCRKRMSADIKALISKVPKQTKYGIPPQLMHTLTSVVDADGNVAVSSNYGEDTSKVSFAKVVGQTQGGDPATAKTFNYFRVPYDLPVSRPAFDPVNVCPTINGSFGPATIARNADSSADQSPTLEVVLKGPLGRVFRTYYDAAGRLLRDIDSGGRGTDYNYDAAGLTGVLTPSLRRTCLTYDAFGKPISMTSLPAPNKSGGVLTETLTYDAAEQLIEIQAKAGAVEQARQYILRDLWERMRGIGTAVDATHVIWTCYRYSDTPLNVSGAGSAGVHMHLASPAASPSPVFPTPYPILPVCSSLAKGGFAHRDALPSVVINPDKSEVHLEGMTATGPSEIIYDALSASPVARFLTYDSFGRVNGTGLRDPATGQPIYSSVETWLTDVEGLVEARHLADQADPTRKIDITYGYDRSWRLRAISGPLVSVALAYDAMGRVTSVVATPKGTSGATGDVRAACADYDPYGAVIRTISPQGVVTDYDYKATGQLMEVTAGPIMILPSPLGRSFAPCSPQTSLRRTLLDPREKVASYEYSSAGLLQSSKISGESLWYNYDGHDRLALVDALDSTTRAAGGKSHSVIRHLALGYDGYNLSWQAVVEADPVTGVVNLTKLPNYLSGSVHSAVQYQFDELGRPTSNKRWQFVEHGSMTAEAQPFAMTTHQYDDAHNVETATYPSGTVVETKRDGNARPTLFTIAKGEPAETRTAVDYSRSGLDIEKVTTPSAAPGGTFRQSASYAPSGQLIKIDVQAAPLLRSTLDAVGRVIAVTRSSGAQELLDYDAYGELIGVHERSAQEPAVSTAVFAWTRDGLLRGTTDGASNITSRAYDGLGRLMSQTSGLGTTIYQYLVGTDLPVSSSDAAGTINWEYDSGGKIIEERVVDAAGRTQTGATRFGYDALGNLTSAAITRPGDQASRSVDLIYDSVGRRVSETNNDADTTILHAYGSRSDTMTVTTNGETTTIVRSLDGVGRLTTLKSGSATAATYTYSGHDPISVQYGNGVRQNFGYDTQGRIVSSTLALQSATIAKISRSFGADNLPHRSDLSLGPENIISRVYATDFEGRVLAEESFMPGLPSTMTYDNNEALGQIDAEALRYQIDRANNWLSRSGPGALSFTTDSANRYATVNTEVVPNIAGGGPEKLGTTTYRWDGLNRITSETGSRGAAFWTFDALGRPAVETDEAGAVTHLVWDGATLLGTSAAAKGNLLAIAGSDDAPAALSKSGVLSEFVHADFDRSVFAVTDTNAHLAQAVAYSAYGVPTLFGGDGHLSAARPLSPFLFQGAFYVPSLQNYRMGARTYEPNFGRFAEPDPAGLAGGLNLFAFVGDQPLTLSDPYGTNSRPGAWSAPTSYTPWADTLTSDIQVTALGNAYDDLVGAGSNWSTRVVGLGSLFVHLPLAVAETVDNAIGAFTGNIADQNFLRGEGRNWDADQASDRAGRRILLGLVAGGGVTALESGLLTNEVTTGTLVGSGTLMANEGSAAGISASAGGSGVGAGIGAVASGNVDKLSGPGETFVQNAQRVSANAWSPFTTSPSNPSVGPAFETLEEAGATGGGHQAEVELFRNGTLVQRWFESSHTGDSFGGHTEQKALARIMDYFDRYGSEEAEVKIFGFHNPCPYGQGCLNTMQGFADEFDVLTDYRSARATYTIIPHE